ncbi:MAG: AMP-binding protein, partial [Caldilineales bacterium]|nr:AMP-binding protein [Caldilineales bacterium]
LVLAGPQGEALGLPLVRFCERQGVTVLHMPAPVFHALVDDLEAAGVRCHVPLRLLMLGGEAPSVERLRAFTALVGRALPLITLYGPTEATITATFHRTTTDVPEDVERLPIGRPIANVQVYAVDEQMQPVPVGVPGELLIGGAGVALGYLNRPELTAERFLPDPFSVISDQLSVISHQSDDGDNRLPITDHPSPFTVHRSPTTAPRSPLPAPRLYKTGDLVRWLPDGNLEFLGRADDQVKIRGFRVEPGEVEAALAASPEVKEAVVVTREATGGGKQLVAYVVPQPGATVTPDHLRRHLRQRLPDFMVPAAFVVLEALPLTATGKINRRALPAPEPEVAAPDKGYHAPRSPVEEMLAEIWARVLNRPRVGIHEDFFEIGGHSLLATQVVSRVREAFGVELPLQALFDAPTVAGLAQRIQAARAAALGLQAPPIRPRPADGPPPLSFAQQRLWFLDQLEPGNLFYNIPTVVRLLGELDVDRLREALNRLVRRHAQLRTTFRNVGGQPVQMTAPDATVPLPVDDLTDLPAEEREAEALRRAQDEVKQPFHLDGSVSPSLLRGRLIKLADDDHLAVFTVHHIVADGWSMAILVRELGTLYTALATDADADPLPPLAVEYTDYAAWQREWLSGEGDWSPLERQLRYWREQLAGSTTLLNLPTDRPRPAVMTWRGATEHFTLPKALSDRLLALGRQEGATLFMTLLAAYQTLLYRYSGQSDINVGTPIAGRHYPEVENVVGFFVNTLVMRARFDQVHTFRELLRQVRQTALDAYAHQDVPFEMLVDALQPERALSHSPLFQVAFGLQNIPMQPLHLPGLVIQPVAVDSGTAKFDLTLAMAETEAGLSGAIEYNTDLFNGDTIRRMVGHLQTLLEAVAANPDAAIATLPLLTPAELRLMLVEWNETALPTPVDRCAHCLFEARAAAHPDAPAVIMAHRSGAVETLTYGELNRRANQLARYLYKLGVGPETVVGIAIDRTPAMVVAILGVLKAGGAYLPLDPTYPPQRLSYMIGDSQIPVLLTTSYLLPRLPEVDPSVTVLAVDSAWPRLALEPDHDLACSLTPYNAAYVIYTSGSTGQPKGAVLRHRGLSNLAEVQRLAFDVDATCRVLQFSPFSFDASVWEVFMALANGAALVLAPQETLASGLDLVRLMAEQRITHVTLPPSVLSVLPPEPLSDLRVIVAAGERCSAEIVRRWATSQRKPVERHPSARPGLSSQGSEPAVQGRRFFNAYGPTETTVCASMYLCDPAEPDDPPIGRPIGNCRLYVVDANLQPVPIGVPGELLIGGVNVGRGYLNRPELTAERFVPDPFAEVGDQKFGIAGFELRATRGPFPVGEPWSFDADHLLYRTGDLVRYRPDGNVEFLGRMDDQVKVRGFRIELGEVEAALREHPAVQDAVVTAHGDVLHAYYIPAPRSDDLSRLEAAVRPAGLTGEAATRKETAAELRAFLRKRLPEYMVPATYTALDAFPRSPAGKVDRRRLPAPDQAGREATADYVAPRTLVEERLAALCAQLLNVERVGVEDNFFELGGHSLLA